MANNEIVSLGDRMAMRCFEVGTVVGFKYDKHRHRIAIIKAGKIVEYHRTDRCIPVYS